MLLLSLAYTAAAAICHRSMCSCVLRHRTTSSLWLEFVAKKVAAEARCHNPGLSRRQAGHPRNSCGHSIPCMFGESCAMNEVFISIWEKAVCSHIPMAPTASCKLGSLTPASCTRRGQAGSFSDRRGTFPGTD